MFKRISIRELLLLTLLCAVIVVQVRDRVLPNPLAAYGDYRIDQHVMAEAACEVDVSAKLLDGELVGGYAGERVLHRGYAIIDCDETKHGEVVERIKQKVRSTFVSAEWKYVENGSTRDDWQVTAFKDGTMAQLLFQFTGATDSIRTRKLGVQWAEMGYSRRWRFELQ